MSLIGYTVNLRSLPRGKAAPRQADGKVGFGNAPRGKAYVQSGWTSRLAWFLEGNGARPEPHQWRTADGAARCVRCGVRLDDPGVAVPAACDECAEAVAEFLDAYMGDRS